MGLLGMGVSLLVEGILFLRGLKGKPKGPPRFFFGGGPQKSHTHIVSGGADSEPLRY